MGEKGLKEKKKPKQRIFSI